MTLPWLQLFSSIAQIVVALLLQLLQFYRTVNEYYGAFDSDHPATKFVLQLILEGVVLQKIFSFMERRRILSRNYLTTNGVVNFSLNIFEGSGDSGVPVLKFRTVMDLSFSHIVDQQLIRKCAAH